eukprot:2350631-Pleurochrysis_carterae.AAC.1
MLLSGPLPFAQRRGLGLGRLPWPPVCRRDWCDRRADAESLDCRALHAIHCAGVRGLVARCRRFVSSPAPALLEHRCLVLRADAQPSSQARRTEDIFCDASPFASALNSTLRSAASLFTEAPTNLSLSEFSLRLDSSNHKRWTDQWKCWCYSHANG